MKKIVFVCESMNFGGIERVINILTSNLVNNYSIDIIVTTDNKPPSYKNDNRINIIYLNEKKSKFKILNKLNKSRMLKSTINKNSYDLCICFGYKVCMSMLLNKKNNMKIIISERTDPDSYGNQLIRTLRNKLYKKANLMICQTNFVKEYYEKIGLKNCTVIPNPIKDNLPKRFNGKRRHVIVNFCRLNPQKNLKLLIDSFSIFYEKFNDYELIIYGEGESKKELEDYIEKMGLKEAIFIKNFQNDIHNLIIDAKMFVSSSDFEGISNSMLEALAIGLPSICTDCPVGGARLAIKTYENGILVPIRDEVRMSQAMIELANNEELSERLSRNSVSIRDKFSSKKITELWIERIEEVMRRE